MTEPQATTLFLDIGGVLLTNGWDHIARGQAAETFGLDLEEMNERHHLTFDTYELGKLSLDEYLKRTIFYRQRPFSPRKFKDFMFSRSRPFPEMLDFFRRLKGRCKLKIVAVSNEGRELTLHRIDTFGLKSIIDVFVSSCFVHFRKPDADIYSIAMDIAQVSPTEVIYIDDRDMFVQIATGLGIRSIHHTDYETTRRALVEAGFTVEH